MRQRISYARFYERKNPRKKITLNFVCIYYIIMCHHMGVRKRHLAETIYSIKFLAETINYPGMNTPIARRRILYNIILFTILYYYILP